MQQTYKLHVKDITHDMCNKIKSSPFGIHIHDKEVRCKRSYKIKGYLKSVILKLLANV